MADSWHYKLLGIEFGPVPFDALIQLAQSSSIGPTDEVREGEAGEWVSASSIVGLFSTPQSKPQEPSPAVDAGFDAVGGWQHVVFLAKFRAGIRTGSAGRIQEDD